MQQVDVWEASKNSDMTEGRGHGILIANFAFEEDAKRAVKGLGVMGVGDGDVSHKRIIIYKSYDEFVQHTQADIKRRALDKLTSEEKRVLGL